MTGRRRVAVVTGGGGGIGGAIAEELGRGGWFVVTVDPLVTLEGDAQLAQPQETTADRIVAAGGSARASSASVTDADALHALFAELADDHGGLDAVVNVAGITRQTYFASGTEDDWLAVATVPLAGWLNVLGAALPLMAAAGHGRILGVTSGSGWRAADAGAYSCAKRAVASSTWQLGRCAPPGVTVNAVSPIAATRMVAAALERARAAGRSGGGGGLTLDSMPGPEDLAPLVAHVVGDGAGWCNGRVLFAGGSEVAVVDGPRLMEVVRTDGATSLDRVLEVVVPRALAKAEAGQATAGGSNPRFGSVFTEPTGDLLPAADVRSCAVVSDRPALATALEAALDARSVTCHRIDLEHGFGDAARALGALAEAAGPLDAVVLAPDGERAATGPADGWVRVLAEHEGIVGRLHTDASWWRATADHAAGTDRPVRLVTLTDATTAGGASRAQVAAQQARVA
ncbi:MAG TPA: SDR family NAD(P)-dependent oxidoreductase, partial [Acidimicrobiales bacterium]|nr:SDR family NAD(P)-dependent oxidoreductase [Acidimicrobiales bacterium]